MMKVMNNRISLFLSVCCFSLLFSMLLEFRVPLPYCVDNPSIGYLYMNMSACKQAPGGGEGVDWIERKEF